MTHPRTRLDDIIYQPIRFSIVAALAAADELEFAAVRDSIEVSDSLLSQHATRLEEAGYVRVRKGHVGKRPRTWFALTAEGRMAFNNHLSALQAIVAGQSDLV
jgi:DNA-binding MarR family transcriptional regulator